MILSREKFWGAIVTRILKSPIYLEMGLSKKGNFSKPHSQCPEPQMLNSTIFETEYFCGFVINEFNSSFEVRRGKNCGIAKCNTWKHHVSKQGCFFPLKFFDG